MAKSTDSGEAAQGINTDHSAARRSRSRAPIIQDSNSTPSTPRPTPGLATSHISIDARFGSAALLKHVVDSAALRFSEAELYFTPEGLHMTAMDGPRVAFMEFQLKKRDFEFYKCTQNQQLFLSLKNFQKVLNCASKDDRLKLDYINEDDIVKITFTDDSIGKVEEIRFRLWERFDTYASPADSKAPYFFTCAMPSKRFSDVCSHLESFGDKVAIKAKNGTIAFCADGEMGSNTIKIRPNVTEEVNIEMLPDCDYLKFFSTGALKQIAKAVNVSRVVEISAIKEYPIKIHYPIGENSSLMFYLAPRLDGDLPEELQTQPLF